MKENQTSAQYHCTLLNLQSVFEPHPPLFKTLFLVIKEKTTQSKNRKKACKMEKIYPINMKIPGGRFTNVS